LSRDEPLWVGRFTLNAFRAAINALLAAAPDPTSEGKPETIAHLKKMYEAEDPETIGKMIAHAVRIAYARESFGQALLDRPDVIKELARLGREHRQRRALGKPENKG
jgi:hypothetical protein